MRIVYFIREDYKENVGGDTIQMLKTKQYIEKIYLDVSICISSDIESKEVIQSADLVHIFNTQTIDFSYSVYKICKDYNKKIVISTIFWDLRPAYYVFSMFKYIRWNPNKLVKLFEKPSRIIYLLLAKCNINNNIFYGKKKLLEEMLNGVDMLLPNSDEELILLEKIYGFSRGQLLVKARTIPNAIEIVNTKDIRLQMEGEIKDYILQVGRIGPVKNQLSVIKAMKKLKHIPLVFIGKPENEKYYQKCKKLAKKRGEVYFFDEVEHSMMNTFYSNALCHVNPSFRESPGLVSLEAMYNDIPVVVSNKKYCPTKYYEFEKYAYICDPYSKKSILNAIISAIGENKKELNKEKYFSYFSYENVAKLTYESYKKIIK